MTAETPALPEAAPGADARRDLALYAQICGNVSLPELLDLLLAEVDRTDSFDGVLVKLIDGSGKNTICHRVRMPAGYEELETTYLGVKFPLEELGDATNQAFHSGRSIHLDNSNIKDYPGPTQVRFEYMRAHAVAVLPIGGRSKTLGTLTIYNQAAPVSPAAAQRLEHVCDIVGGQLEVALHAAELEQREARLQAAETQQQEFLRFVTTINDFTATEQIYDEVSRELLRRHPFDFVGIAVQEADELVVQKLTLARPKFADRFRRLEEFYYSTRVPLEANGSGLAIVFLQDSALYFPDMQAIKDVPVHPKDREALDLMETPRSFFMAPIRRQGKPSGVFWLASMEQPVALSDQDRRFLDLLGAFIGAALGNAQLYGLVAKQYQAIERLNDQLQERVEHLSVEATTDKLTGLNNFGYFEKELSRRLSEADRRSDRQAMALAIIDVDHFKRFNDTYGHQAGNQVLQEIARRMQAVGREMDIPCRYGGEEFVVILPKCDLDGAARFGERVRAEIAATPFYVDGRYLPLSISVGCAEYRAGEGLAGFIERADQALYKAKHAGRNRVETSAGG